MIIRRNNGRWKVKRDSYLLDTKEGRKEIFFNDTWRANRPSPLWFLSRDHGRDTGRTIRPRIQRDVRATKTYSIILLSALISSRQLMEKKREIPLYLVRVHLLPLVCYSRLCPPFDPFQPFPPTFFSCQRIAANETAISGRVKPIGTPSAFRVGRDFVAAFQLFDFFYLPTTSNCFRFSSVTRRQERESRLYRCTSTLRIPIISYSCIS